MRQKNKMGLNPDKFNIIHFGAMGIANGLDYIIDAAKTALDQNLNNIEFVFLGDGSTKKELYSKVNKLELNNVKFLGAKPMNEVSEIVNACDVSLVSFADIDILKTNSPNKLFDSLSAGKPIIVNSSGWTKTMVENNKCGLFSDPKKPEDLVEKIQIIQKDSSIYRLFSTNSRKLAEDKYDISILVPRVVEVIENAVVKNANKKSKIKTIF
jgi:glycosyltransferase involved in cell wall biosynthesis